LVATFENHRAKLINGVAELLTCLSLIRDTRRGMDLKAVGHVYARFHLSPTALYSADLIAIF
jgi:hypothetical protein